MTRHLRILAVLLASAVLATGCAEPSDLLKTAKTAGDAEPAPPHAARPTVIQATRLEQQREVHVLERLPDFRVTAMETFQAPSSGWMHTEVRHLRLRLVNDGAHYSGPLTFRVVGAQKLTGGERTEKVHTEEELDLPKGAETDIEIEYGRKTPWDSARMHFFVYTDPDDEVAEADEKNNVFTHTIVMPHISVLHPSGGEVWHKGRNYTIRWDSAKVTGNLRIRAHTGVSSVRTITDNCRNTGSYRFEVPRNWGAGFYEVEISSLDDRSITAMADGSVVVVPHRPSNWADVPYKIDPQNIEVRVTRAGRIKSKSAEYRRTGSRHQTNFPAPTGTDLDLDFRIPIVYLGAERDKRLECTITLSNDRLTPGTATWNRLQEMLRKTESVQVDPGQNYEDVRFRLPRPAIGALEAFEVPIVAKVSIVAPEDDPRAAFSLTPFLRLLPEE